LTYIEKKTIFAENTEDEEIILINSIMAKYNIIEKKEKVAAYRSLVSPKLMDELKEKILDIVLIQKKYKDKDYSAKKLAEDLGTNTRYISAVVNVRFHMNYTSFVNKFRIEEAMTLLVDKRYQNLNMEEISDMVGFANRQSFYASFYKINGITPRDYKIRALAQHPNMDTRGKGRKKTTKQE
jgi:YesN/AraC family two-component response regulator